MRPVEVDYFSLHNRKEKEIRIEMLDYDYVNNCCDLDELKGILCTLRSGKEGRYPDLEKVTEERLLQVMPERERRKIQIMQQGPTSSEVSVEQEGLDAWIEQMQHKNQLLSEARQAKTRHVPPVRGQPQEETKAESSFPSKGKQSQQKISAYDWRAWEKFDVDQALEEMDHEEVERREKAKVAREEQERRSKARRKELEALPSYIDVESLTDVEREVYATMEKQKGNECFKAGETEDAIMYYTRSIAFDDNNAILYSNRALAYLRLKHFQNAEDDCTRAIELDPTYTKGWSRRAMTRHRRGKYEQAILDFKEALELEPENKDLAKLLAKSQEKWKEVEGEQFQRFDSQKKIEVISESDYADEPTTYQKVGTVSSNEFRRIEIIEDDDDDDDDDEVPRFEFLN